MQHNTYAKPASNATLRALANMRFNYTLHEHDVYLTNEFVCNDNDELSKLRIRNAARD